MSSALKPKADLDLAAAADYVSLGTSGYVTGLSTLQSEAALYQSIDALRHHPSPLEFSLDWLREQKDQFIKTSKSRIDPHELSEQLEAIFGMLERHESLSVITGPPGAAKTTIASLWARIARNKYPEMPILVLAQEKTALQRLQERIDIPGSTAWLMEEALNKTAPWPRGAAIIIDEAGLFGTDVIARLLRKAREIDAVKIILIGDDKQLVSDAPGQPFRWLCEQAATDKIILQHSFRQKNLWLREAVNSLYKGDLRDALRLMPHHFCDKADIVPTVKKLLDDAQPDSTLVILHGDDWLQHHLPPALAPFRILSLAEAQGLAIDRVVLVLGQAVNMGELLVGCSRQRFDLDIVVDTAIYADADAFIAQAQPYPKNLMALDVLPPDDVLTLAGK